MPTELPRPDTKKDKKAATEVAEVTKAPFRKMSGRDKVAALLLAMGKPLASRILKHFDETEIKVLVKSASELGMVPRAVLDDVIDEFTGKIGEGSDLEGTAGQAEQLLQGILPPDQLAELMADIRGEDKRSVWPRLSQMPETPIAQYLMKEHPQVAAYVLSKANPACTAAVIELMPNEMRKDLMRRMLTIKHVLDLPQEVIEKSLNDDLLHGASRNSEQDVHARIANIINRMKREHSDEVFEDLNEFRPKEAEKVKGLLFTFEDISKLRPEDVATLFDQVPPERVILALKGAEKQVSELILSSLGTRSRRMIEQEVNSGGHVPARDVNKARRAIADLALELSEKGKIELHSDEE
jgi:flagellar motor switch protein FliG